MSASISVRLLRRPTLALALICSVLGAGLGAASAQAHGRDDALPLTPRVDARQSHQEARIARGLASGALTHREARRLRDEQAEIRRVEWLAERDGVVTREERQRLAWMQQRASRHIDEQLHDDQRRGDRYGWDVRDGRDGRGERLAWQH